MEILLLQTHPLAWPAIIGISFIVFCGLLAVGGTKTNQQKAEEVKAKGTPHYVEAVGAVGALASNEYEAITKYILAFAKLNPRVINEFLIQLEGSDDKNAVQMRPENCVGYAVIHPKDEPDTYTSITEAFRHCPDGSYVKPIVKQA